MPRLKTPRQRERIVGGIKDGIPGWENMVLHTGLDKIVVSSVQSRQRKGLVGRSIAQIATAAQQDPIQVLLDLVESENGAVSIITESMNEENMVRFFIPAVCHGRLGWISQPGPPASALVRHLSPGDSPGGAGIGCIVHGNGRP